MKHIVVIGGGMAGMTAALRAAEEGARVTLLERQERIGKKILLTGNGRCNLSNKKIYESFYLAKDRELLNGILETFQRSEKEFWQELGLLLKEKNGCIYPWSGQASTVLNCFLLRLKEKKIEILTDHEVTGISKKQKSFELDIENGKEKITADAVILACGGKAGVYGEETKNGYVLCKQMGHQILPCYPALVQTICEGGYFKSVSGVRADVHISLMIGDKTVDEEDGELQITDRGLSGIAVFQLSRYLGKALAEGRDAYFLVDFLPQISKSECRRMMLERRERMRNRNAEEFFAGILHKKLIVMLLKEQGISPGGSIHMVEEERFLKLLDSMKEFKVKIKALNDFSHAQISTGGVPLSEVTKNLESRITEGLYLTGEMLDAAGACGGYNLFFAAATGYLAGSHAAKGLAGGTHAVN